MDDMEQLILQLVQDIFNRLLAKNMSLATAESCTGGYLAHILTTLPGSSDIYKGGVVVYTALAKTTLLKINKTIIDSFGEVSKEVAIEMAKNTRLCLNTTFALATTGYAGPSGGSANNPCGTVYMAIATTDDIIVQKQLYNNKTRKEIIEQSSLDILKLLTTLIL
ncbi:MAG: CinA family protein [Solitalea-like symbiont of Tyrophagus putrescentiae]